MLVQDIINFAVRGPLKQLSIAEIGIDDPNREENILDLLSYINLATIEIYTRFNLATQSKLLTNVIDGAAYTMETDYIHLLYAEADDDDKTEIPINDEEANFSVFTPAPYQIYISKDEELFGDITGVYITYVAVPSLVTDENDTVALQYQFLQPLLQHIAYQGHSALSSTTQDESENLYNRFKKACDRIEERGLVSPDNQRNAKLSDRGYP